mgnify:CR=1 FL=1
MWKNYHPVVPLEFHDIACMQSQAEQWSKVKVEKADRSDFHRAQRAKKYAAKEAIERHAFNDDIGGI